MREVARREEASPVDLPPLYETVDPDALQGLVASADDEAFSVEFSYHGYEVTVAADGSVDVEG